METIAKYSKEPSNELNRLLQTVNCAKRILSAVNSAKRNAENLRRLEEIQKRLEFGGGSSGDKACQLFQRFNFTQ